MFLTFLANMTYVSSLFTLKESDIGQFNPTLLDGLLSLFMARGVVPTANAKLAQGIQLPVVPGKYVQDVALISV
jgi:hypothetical protein